MIKYTECFHSVQGEGKYTGQASVFFRLWGCNLKCAGFGQDNPLEHDTWNLEFRDYDPKANNIKSYEELPIMALGCDSEYSHNPKYNYLAKKVTTEEAAIAILETLPNKTFRDQHLIFTGGEPMMNQNSIVDIMYVLRELSELPDAVTIETNGTKPLSMEFMEMIEDLSIVDFSFSVSPKLRNVTGEDPEKTIKPVIVNEYAEFAEVWLKPVVNDTDLCWDEVDMMIRVFKEQRNLRAVPVYIMPCGATQEEQEQSGYMASISNKALARGWNVSVRVHIFIYGNASGT